MRKFLFVLLVMFSTSCSANKTTIQVICHYHSGDKVYYPLLWRGDWDATFTLVFRDKKIYVPRALCEIDETVLAG